MKVMIDSTLLSTLPSYPITINTLSIVICVKNILEIRGGFCYETRVLCTLSSKYSLV